MGHAGRAGAGRGGPGVDGVPGSGSPGGRPARPGGVPLALPTLMCAMPIAANTSILAGVYEGDVESASSLVFLSTLLCVATIPALALLVGV